MRATGYLRVSTDAQAGEIGSASSPRPKPFGTSPRARGMTWSLGTPMPGFLVEHLSAQNCNASSRIPGQDSSKSSWLPRWTVSRAT